MLTITSIANLEKCVWHKKIKSFFRLWQHLPRRHFALPAETRTPALQLLNRDHVQHGVQEEEIKARSRKEHFQVFIRFYFCFSGQCQCFTLFYLAGKVTLRFLLCLYRAFFTFFKEVYICDAQASLLYSLDIAFHSGMSCWNFYTRVFTKQNTHLLWV